MDQRYIGGKILFWQLPLADPATGCPATLDLPVGEQKFCLVSIRSPVPEKYLRTFRSAYAAILKRTREVPLVS